MSRPRLSSHWARKVVVSWWTWDNTQFLFVGLSVYRCCVSRWCPCLIDVVVVVGRPSSSSSSFPWNRIIGETLDERELIGFSLSLHKRVKVKRISSSSRSSRSNNSQTTHYVKESNKDWKDLSTSSTTRLTTVEEAYSSWEIISSDFYYSFN